MNELVKNLSSGKHNIIVGGTANADDPLKEFREAVERNFVHVRFTETRGGTELGFHLEENQCDFSKGDLKKGEGKVRVAGKIKLDYVPVRVVADINIKKLSGKGFLEILEDS